MRKKYLTPLFFCIMITIASSIFLLQAKDTRSRQSAAVIIEKTIQKEGIEAAKQVFAKMRQAPEGTYSFAEKEFVALANRLVRKKKTREAIDVLNLCLPVFLDSPSILFNLAQAYKEHGDQESFYKYFRKMVIARQKSQLEDFLKKNRGKLLTTADAVIQKHLESTGGIKAWQTIKTMKIQFTLHDTTGRGGVLERYYKRPGFFRQGIEGSDSFTSTDGKKVWRVRKGVWKEIEGKPYKRMASLDNFFIGYRKSGVVYDFIGVEVLNHAPVYHLKRTFWDKHQEDLYFSIKAGYLTEKLTPYNLGPTYFTLWDYRRVGEVMIPHVRMRLMGGFAPPHGVVIKEVRTDIPLDDSLFIKKDQ